MARIKANLRALELLRDLESEDRLPTIEEKRILAKFSGWGHSPQVFDEIKARDWEAHQNGQYTYGHSPAVLKNWADRFHEHYLKLRKVLTSEEWSRAEASTLNAHYTSREVIEHGLWAIARRLGFEGGRVLENSAGIGHVLGLAPPGLNSRFTACELDSTTGRMLRKLYPQATVHVMGFQDARIPAHSQDLVIGNFPFNKEGWTGDKYPFSLHNQFFARSVDLTVPGGLIVAITSDSTMDGPVSATFRRWMAQRADLVSAIRLPNNTFKKNAGTEVTTDILVFRKKEAQQFENAEGFINTKPMETGKVLEDGTPETVEVNEYYHRHPDMMLGRMTRDGKMYEDGRPALIAHPDRELLPQLQEAVRKFPEGIVRKSLFVDEPQPTTFGQAELAEAHHKEGSYQIRNARVCQVRRGELVPPEFDDDLQLCRQAEKWIGVRDAAKELFARELSPQSSEEEVETARCTLRRLYDAYVYSYGRVNKCSRAFINDPESSIPAALENEATQKYQVRLKSGKHVDRLRQVYVPADILSKRALYPTSPPERAESVADAATISRSWKGAFDLDYMGSLLGKSPEDVKQEIIAKGLGFEDPATGRVVPKDEYLSGNVKEKLRVAQEACGENPRYQGNVEALAAVQPEELKIHQIKFSLGATWMPTAVIDGWLDHVFDRRGVGHVTRVPHTGRFIVQWDSRMRDDARNTDTFAGGGVPAKELIEDALNLKVSIAYDEVRDPETHKPKRQESRAHSSGAGCPAEIEGCLFPMGAQIRLRAGNRRRIQPGSQRLPPATMGSG